MADIGNEVIAELALFGISLTLSVFTSVALAQFGRWHWHDVSSRSLQSVTGGPPELQPPYI